MPPPAPARAVSGGRRVGWRQCRVLRRRGPSPRAPRPVAAMPRSASARSVSASAVSGGGNAASCVGAVRFPGAPRPVAAMPRSASARSVSPGRRVRWRQCRVLRRRGPSPASAVSGGGNAACLRRRGPSSRGAASGGGTAESCVGNAAFCVGAGRLRNSTHKNKNHCLQFVNICPGLFNQVVGAGARMSSHHRGAPQRRPQCPHISTL